MPSMKKLQLPFGPGNKQIMGLLPKNGMFFGEEKFFDPKDPDPTPAPGPAAASIKLAADEKKRAARLSETVPTRKKEPRCCPPRAARGLAAKGI